MSLKIKERNMRVKFSEYMKEQIEARYISGLFKEDLASTFIPSFYAEGRQFTEEMIGTRMRANRYVISPNLRALTNNTVRVKSFDYMMSKANIDLRRVSSNILKIKRSGDVNLTSIGYGGFSINIIHFMAKLGELTGQSRWIKKLTIYEDDKISLTNSFRIYKDMSLIQYQENNRHKFRLLEDDENIAENSSLIPRRFNSMDKDTIIYKRKENRRFGMKDFIFGAPDFDTRKLFEDIPFIFTGHSGNEVEFYASPVVDSDLTRETYGKIDLDYFFLNILKSAEQMIDMMANTDPSEYAKDSLIFKYTSEGSI